MKLEVVKTQPQYQITLTNEEAAVLLGVGNACGMGVNEVYFSPGNLKNPLAARPTESRKVLIALAQMLEHAGVCY